MLDKEIQFLKSPINEQQAIEIAKKFATGGGGSGDVVGPSSSTVNALARYDATTGKLIKNSVAILDDSGNLSGINNLSATGNLTLSGLAKRILGDFSNATRSNRLAVQTTTTNGNTRLPFLPNGTARLSGVDLHDGTDLDNSSFLQVHSDGINNHCGLNSTKVGTGARKDLVFQIDGITKAKINEADGKFNIDTLTASLLIGTDASKNLQSVTTATASVGTDFAITYSGSTITYSIPDASITARGLTTTALQGFTGLKSFGSNINVSNGNTVTNISGATTGTYTTVPSVAIAAPTGAGGVQATATASMQLLASSTIANGGSGYAVGNTITLSGGTSTIAAVLTVLTLSGSAVATYSITTAGSYTSLPTNPIATTTNGAGTGFTLTGSWGVIANGFNITNAGLGYIEQPAVTFSPTGATANASIGSSVSLKGLGNTLNFFTSANGLTNIPTLQLVGQNVGILTSTIGSALQVNGGAAIGYSTSTTAPTNGLDVSGNAIFGKGSANYITISGAAAGFGVTLSATGSDTSIPIVIVPKGLSGIQAAQTTNSTVGGNVRGLNSVDLQTYSRTAASQVASGSYAVLSGGARNTASGSTSVCAGGVDNVASGTGATVSGGNSNTASAVNSTVIGGTFNIADGIGSTASGYYATARGVNGMFAMAPCNAPIAAVVGTTQFPYLALGRQTTDATPTILTSDSSAASATNQMVLRDNSQLTFKIDVTAGITGAGSTAAWEFKGTIKRGANAAATSIDGSVTKTLITTVAGSATWDCNVTADTTLGCLRVTFTGQAATTIRAGAKITGIQIAY